jgi:nicotinamide-nucleotide amidase
VSRSSISSCRVAPDRGRARVRSGSRYDPAVDAALLCIGTELTRGEIANTNATWLAERLTDANVTVRAIDVVADEAPHIVAALHRLSRDHDLLVSTGGLGPTTDDITTSCVAAALGVPLERHGPSLEALHARLVRAGRALTASNEKQADFPAGATVLANPNGTAPGFSIRIGRASLFVLPGVPREMKPMFDAHALPFVRAARRRGVAQVRLKTFGLPESTVNDHLAGIEVEHDVVIGYRARYPEIEVKVLAHRPTQAAAEQAARRAADRARDRLGDVVYGEGTVTLPEAVGDLLVQRGLTLGTAESCTGGLVGALLTEGAGASAFFRGSVVAYADEVKRSVLGVEEAALTQHGAVSAVVARQMAEGARRALGVDIAASLTGIAGPGGGTPDKPVGFVHYAVATETGTRDARLEIPGDRGMVRRRAAFAVLALVREILIAPPAPGGEPRP